MSKEAVKYPSGDFEFFDKQGHRGCRGLMPENTIPAMINALGMPITTLEMDVVITKDKKVILSHEPFFNHEITTTANGSFINEEEEKDFNIYKMTFAETKKFDVGLKPHPRFPQQQKIAVTKPLLSEVFIAIKEAMMTRRKPIPLYNIETKSLKQSVRRNISRFPEDFMFTLNLDEWNAIRSQIVMFNKGKGKFPKYLPFAFTEHGVAMISGVLKSEKALMMNISIIRMFIEMKRVLIKNASIKGQLQEMRERIGEHDVQLNKIYDTIEHLLDLTMNRVKWNERNIIGFKEDKKPNG